MLKTNVGPCAIACLLLPAVMSADQIVMKNGDTVTGAIIKKDAATLTMKSVNFGTITLPWDQVQSVKSDEPLTVVLPGDKVVNGTLSTAGGKVEVSGAQPQTVAPADIQVIRNAAQQANYEKLLHPNWFHLWTITGSINIAGTQGNAETRTFTTPFTFVRITNHDKTTAYFNFMQASAGVPATNGVCADPSKKPDSIGKCMVQTAQAIRGGWAYDRNLTKRFFLLVFNDNEHDKFQDLNLRTVLGGGAGYTLLKRETDRLDLVAGVDWDRGSFGAIAGPPAVAALVRTSGELFFGDDFSTKLYKRLALTQSYRVFVNMTSTGNYRQNLDAGLAAPLTKYLTWNAAISDRYLSDPVGGLKKNDFIYSTGIGVTLSH